VANIWNSLIITGLQVEVCKRLYHTISPNKPVFFLAAIVVNISSTNKKTTQKGNASQLSKY